LPSSRYNSDFRVVVYQIHPLHLFMSLFLELLVDAVSVDPEIPEAKFECNADRVLNCAW
jgi:hypothetical protein